MKTKNPVGVSVSAWAFALIVLSTVSFAATPILPPPPQLPPQLLPPQMTPTQVMPRSDIVFSIAPESLNRTAFVAGDYNRVISVLIGENRGNVSGKIDSLGFETYTGLTNLRVEINGHWYFANVIASFPDPDFIEWAVNDISVKINPRETVKIVVRGDIPWYGSTVYADLRWFGGDYTSGLFPLRRSARHAIVDELQSEGVGNSSVLATVTPTAGVIKGFEVKGDSQHYYPFLIRAIGPSLAKFGVTNPLQDPSVKVLDARDNVMGENDNWNANDEWTFQQVGAFGLTKGSADSVVIVSLRPGTYTVQVKGFGTG
ncbi:MAG: hypothetical protein Q7R72_02300, partial [bacterium]|nr:hypothetical protein [bacterium]